MIHFTPENIDRFLTRVFEGQATAEELLQLKEWLRDKLHYTYFLHFRKFWNATTGARVSEEVLERAAVDFRRYMNAHPLRQYGRLRWWTAAAAVVLLLSASSYLLFRHSGGLQPTMPLPYAKQYESLNSSRQAVTIRYADGRVENLNEIKQQVQKVADGVLLCRNNERELEYRQQDTTLTELQYNELSVPAGERFSLILADGTRVWLNSETTLRYPVNFTGETREVQLQGQAYFDVHPDKAHPFIVCTENMKVEALGTAFDVSAYNEELEETGMVLVEGSVRVSAGDHQLIAVPDQQVLVKQASGRLAVHTVDARSLTLWKEGVLVIRQLTFKQMVHKLEQWYGVTILNQARVSDTELFNGKFAREDIRKALETISVSAGISYAIEDGQIVLRTAAR